MTRAGGRRVLALLAAVLAVVGVVAALAPLRTVQRPAPAAREVSAPSDEQPAARRPRPGPPHVVVLGDSVPAGTACNCGGFGALLAAHETAGLSNLAAAGLTSGGLLQQVQQDAEVEAALRRATAVTITVGANDFDAGPVADRDCADLSCWAGTSARLTATLDHLLDRVGALVPPTTRVVLTGYWNVFLDGAVGAAQGPRYVATSDALTRQVNALVARAAGVHGALYADVYTPFKGEGNGDDTELLAPDGDHPNSAGQGVLAAAIERALAA